MPRFQLSPGRLGGGDSMVDLYNIVTQAEAKKRDQQINAAKSTVSSLINSYNSAKSQSLQNEIVRTMRDYHGALPQALQLEVEPYIRHGPTSPTAEKRREFLRFNPPPRPPVFNEAPGAEASNRYAQAKHLFNMADYQRGLTSFVHGADVAGDKQNFIPLEEGQGAIRTADGQIMILSAQELGLRELEEKYGFTTREIMLNPNGIPTGNKGFVNMGGRRIMTEETIRPFEADPAKRYGQRIIGTATIPKSAWDIEHPASLRKLLLDWKNPGTDDEMVQDWKKRALKEPKEVATEMSNVWPQYTFRVVNVKKESWFQGVKNVLGFASSTENEALIPIRGRPVPIPDQTGKEYVYYYDANIDLVSNNVGEPLGSYEDAIQMLSTKIIGEAR